MRLLKTHFGLLLLAIGVVLLAVLHWLHITFVNFWLVAPLCLIAGGVAAEVWVEKRRSNY